MRMKRRIKTTLISRIIRKIMSKISKSVLKDNTHSTHRIQSYIFMIPIILMVFMFICLEVYHFFHCLYTEGLTYTISSEIIIIFGMLLGHQLAVLFQKDSNINETTNKLIDKNK